MRTTVWMLGLGLLVTLSVGCSSSRFGLAKSDPPEKPGEDVRVKYGNPWAKPKPEKTPPLTEMPPELAAKFDKARNAKPDGVASLLEKAAAAEGRGDLNGAREQYLKIIDLDQKNGEAHHRLAVIADQQQDQKTADLHYQKALTYNRRDADLLSDLGYSLYLRGNLEESERKLKEALEANPHHRGAHSNLGLVYGKQGKYDQALAAFRQSGTESEAQRNIAQLFPNGRPGAANAALAQRDTGLPNASPDRRGAPPFPAESDPRVANLTLDQVRQRMEQERIAAERQRTASLQNEFRPGLQDPAVQAASGQSPFTPPLPTNRAPEFPANTANYAGQPPAMNPPAANTTPNPWGTPVVPANNAVPLSGLNLLGGPQPTNSAPAFPGQPAVPGAPANMAATPAAPGISPNAYWQGNPNTANPAAATSASEQAAIEKSLRAFAPPPNVMLPLATMPPGTGPNPWGSAAPPTNFNNTGSGAFPSEVQPAGYQAADGNRSTMNSMPDANRLAAQMAFGTGPGSLLPVVSPGPAAAPLPNDVQWAYGESTGDPRAERVNNANYMTPGSNAAAPGSTPPNSIQPTNWNTPSSGLGPQSPWNGWQSPAPAPIQWNPDNAGSNAPAVTPANMTTPGNGSAMTPPQWPGNAEAAPRPASAPPRDWPAQPGANSAPTTIPNWPYAPARP